MITEAGKSYIARNFGVNMCYAMTDVVSCTVYSKAAPSQMVLDTAEILIMLVGGLADWVKTSAGTFTFDTLTAGNNGNPVSLVDALDIEEYCIPGAVTPPVTPPYVPPVTPPGTPPPTGAKDYEILNPTANCDSYNCYVKLNIRNNTNSSSSVYMRVDVDGVPKFKRQVYLLRGATKAQSMALPFTGINDGYHNLTIAVGRVTDTDTYTHRFLVGVGIEPPATAKITKAEIITKLRSKGAIDTNAVSTVPSANKWYIYYGHLEWHTANFEKGIQLRNIKLRNPPTRTTDIKLTENKTSVSELDRSWVLARLAELSYAAAPPVTPPYTPPVTPPYVPPVTPPGTPTEPPEAIKAWIVANYGDGTRVTSDGGRKLHDAMMSNTIAAPYTKADITEGFVLWAEDNPNWETQTICGWINSIGVTNLTEDHGRYVYDLAIGWTTLADRFYDVLSPKPSRLLAALATEDNGRGVYDYAIGWNTLANRFTGCNF